MCSINHQKLLLFWKAGKSQNKYGLRFIQLSVENFLMHSSISCPQTFFEYFRMSYTSFDRLLAGKTNVENQNRRMRSAVPEAEKLSE